METFLISNPIARVSDIMALPKELKQRQAEEFLYQFEENILYNPFSLDVDDDSRRALIMLYNHFGENAEKVGDFSQAIAWYEKSHFLMEHSETLRKDFYEVFLHLSCCYLELLQFSLALRNIYLYESFSTSKRQTCEKIKNSIHAMEEFYTDAID